MVIFNLQEVIRCKIKSIQIHTLYSNLQYVNSYNFITLGNETAICWPEVFSQAFEVMKAAYAYLSVMVTLLPRS